MRISKALDAERCARRGLATQLWPERTFCRDPDPFWDGPTGAVYVGMLLLVAGLYQIVLHSDCLPLLRGTITDVRATRHSVSDPTSALSAESVTGFGLGTAASHPIGCLAATAGRDWVLWYAGLRTRRDSDSLSHRHRNASVGVVCAGLWKRPSGGARVCPLSTDTSNRLLAAL